MAAGCRFERKVITEFPNLGEVPQRPFGKAPLTKWKPTMVATTGMTGIGAKLKLGDAASPETFNAIGNVTSITANQAADQIDATHLLSTTGFREFKQGFKTFSVDFELHFDPDNTTQDDATGLQAAYIAGSTRNYKIDFASADNAGVGAPTTDPVCTFSGVLTNFSFNVTEGMVTGSGTISSSANPSWGAT